MLLSDDILEILKVETALLVAEMKKNLSKSGKSGSNLKRSIKDKAQDTSAQVSMNDYGVFIDKGVSGKNSSNFKGKRKAVFRSKSNFKFGSGKSGGGSSWEQKIDRWMSSKGISGGTDKLGNKISKKSINFLIRRSIFQHGIRGTMFASNAFADFQDELYNRLSTMDLTKNINTQQ